MHLNHCRSCIQIYTTTAETLERRIAEGNVETSGENDDVPKDTTNDSPIEVQPEHGENNSSSHEKSMEAPDSEENRGDGSTGREKRYCI